MKTTLFSYRNLLIVLFLILLAVFVVAQVTDISFVPPTPADGTTIDDISVIITAEKTWFTISNDCEDNLYSKELTKEANTNRWYADITIPDLPNKDYCAKISVITDNHTETGTFNISISKTSWFENYGFYLIAGIFLIILAIAFIIILSVAT